MALFQSQAETTAVSSVLCTTLEDTIPQRESSAIQLCDEFRRLQTQVANIQATLATGANAGTLVMGRVQELERIFLSAGSDIRAM